MTVVGSRIRLYASDGQTVAFDVAIPIGSSAEFHDPATGTLVMKVDALYVVPDSPDPPDNGGGG